MGRYWLRIALGALAIFVVGMAGVTVVRHTTVTLDGDGPITIPLMVFPFRVDGDRLGTIKKLVLLRDVPRRISRVELAVELDDSVSFSRLKDCRIAADMEWDWQPGRPTRERTRAMHGASFRCVLPDSSLPGFEEYGAVRFTATGDTLPLLLPRTAIDDLRRGDLVDSADSAR